MIRMWKKLARRRGRAANTLAGRQDVDENSPADLRRVIGELEDAIAEHEATNAFLRDLLTERWFAAGDDSSRPLASATH